MADKYVKLDDVIDTLEQEWGYEGMREDLYDLPTADVVKVKHGAWTYSENNETMKCTRCRMRMKTYDVRRYCPNCGAKMDGGADE